MAALEEITFFPLQGTAPRFLGFPACGLLSKRFTIIHLNVCATQDTFPQKKPKYTVYYKSLKFIKV
jgi:hypothetical protein